MNIFLLSSTNRKAGNIVVWGLQTVYSRRVRYEHSYTVHISYMVDINFGNIVCYIWSTLISAKLLNFEHSKTFSGVRWIATIKNWTRSVQLFWRDTNKRQISKVIFIVSFTTTDSEMISFWINLAKQPSTGITKLCLLNAFFTKSKNRCLIKVLLMWKKPQVKVKMKII